MLPREVPCPEKAQGQRGETSPWNTAAELCKLTTNLTSTSNKVKIIGDFEKGSSGEMIKVNGD